MKKDDVCKRYNAPAAMPKPDQIAGVSFNFFTDSSTIIHGLRHPREDGVSGWYLWKGEYSESKDFFQATHIEHIISTIPDIEPYLALPPSWRFLVDVSNAYEDVWRDNELIEIEN
ncbi:MAG: hypothetical protein WBP22_03240 [Candidatus Saccharimonas sp.]